MTERIEMISLWLRGECNISELSRRYGVSRRNIYKWLERYEERGWEGLEELSRAPHRQAMAIGPEMESLILELRKR